MSFCRQRATTVFLGMAGENFVSAEGCGTMARHRALLRLRQTFSPPPETRVARLQKQFPAGPDTIKRRKPPKNGVTVVFSVVFVLFSCLEGGPAVRGGTLMISLGCVPASADQMFHSNPLLALQPAQGAPSFPGSLRLEERSAILKSYLVRLHRSLGGANH